MRFEEGSRGPPDRRRAARAGRRRAARHPPGQGDPLRRRRRPRVPEPHLDRRARHDAQGRRRGHLAVDPPPRRRQGQEEREDYLRFAPWKAEKEGEHDMDAERFAELARARAVHPHRLRQRLRQAVARPTSTAAPAAAARASPTSTTSRRNGPVVASFPATSADQLMLVTDQAKLIRIGARLAARHRPRLGRRALFNVADDEHVVSAVRLDERTSRRTSEDAESTRPIARAGRHADRRRRSRRRCRRRPGGRRMSVADARRLQGADGRADGSSWKPTAPSPARRSISPTATSTCRPPSSSTRPWPSISPGRTICTSPRSICRCWAMR